MIRRMTANQVGKLHKSELAIKYMELQDAYFNQTKLQPPAAIPEPEETVVTSAQQVYTGLSEGQLRKLAYYYKDCNMANMQFPCAGKYPSWDEGFQFLALLEKAVLPMVPYGSRRRYHEVLGELILRFTDPAVEQMRAFYKDTTGQERPLK